MMTPREADRTQLVLYPQSQIISGNYSADESIANPDYNRYRDLMSQWKANQTISVEFVELILECIIPIEIQKEIQEAYYEGEECGRDQAYETMDSEYKDQIPCRAGVESLLQSVSDSETKVDEALETLKEASDNLCDARSDIQGFFDDMQR